MKLVAIVRAPERLDDAVRCVAATTGLTLAEARMRLSPEPPALIARLEPGPADALVAALRGVGVAALSMPAQPPSDRDRLVARTFSFEPSRVTFTARDGETIELPWGDVVVVLRGLRSSRAVVERTENTKRFSAATALATGGLKLSRTAPRTDRSSSESTEQVILVYARDGRAVTLSETQVEFSRLGAALQPSSTANMGELARRIREGAEGAFHDDRLLRLARRPLPFLGGGESRTQTTAVAISRTDSGGALDALAEALRQGVAEGLLPPGRIR